MATNTRQTVREYMIDHYGLGRRETNTGTDTNAITDDANLGGHGAADGLEVGCRVLITSGNRDGDDSRLATRPVLTTGKATVDPAFSGALANSDTYEILFKPLVFDAGDGEHSVHSAITQATTEFPWERRLVPITSVTDGDMLESGTTDWTETGDGSISKVAATFPHGLRVLRMTGVSADDYIASGNIAVEEQKTYYLEVTGMIASSADAADQGTLVLYDVTNGASISLDEDTIDRFEPELLVNTAVSMPSGCEQVQIRLEADNAGDIIDWANLIFRKNESEEFVLQDRPVRVLDIGRVFATSQHTWSKRGKAPGPSWYEVPSRPQSLDAGLWSLHLDGSVAGYSVWYEEFVQTADLTADSDTTAIPVEHLAAVAAEILLRPIRAMSTEWAARYEKASRAAARYKADYMSKNRVVVNEAKREFVLPTV